MATSSMVHIRMDDQLKDRATETLSLMGMNLSDAIRIFLTRVVADQEMPFPIQVPKRALASQSANHLDEESLVSANAFVELVRDRPDFSAAILFGSRARKTHRPDSDVDIAVLLSGPPGKFLETKLAMADLAFDVMLQTGIRVQALPIWLDEWANPSLYANPQLLHNIKSEGIRL